MEFIKNNNEKSNKYGLVEKILSITFLHNGYLNF